MRRVPCPIHGYGERGHCVCGLAVLSHSLALHLKAGRLRAAIRVFGKLARGFAIVVLGAGAAKQ